MRSQRLSYAYSISTHAPHITIGRYPTDNFGRNTLSSKILWIYSIHCSYARELVRASTIKPQYSTSVWWTTHRVVLSYKCQWWFVFKLIPTVYPWITRSKYKIKTFFKLLPNNPKFNRSWTSIWSTFSFVLTIIK